MALSDEERQDIAGSLAFLMHLVVVPRQGEGQRVKQHPARRRLVGEDIHLVGRMSLMALDEDETGR